MQQRYAPPKAASTRTADLRRCASASKTKRLANFLIDTVVTIVPLNVAFVVFQPTVAVAELAIWINLALMMFYYVFLEYSLGWTVGKLVTGTRVVSRNSRKLSLGQVIGRTLVRNVPFDPFSFLILGEGMHDRWSNTRVVALNTGAAPIEELMTLASEAARRRAFGEAIAHFEGVLNHPELDLLERPEVLMDLAVVYRKQRDWSSAEDCAHEAHAAATEIEQRQLQAHSLATLGKVLIAKRKAGAAGPRDLDSAIDSLERAADLYDEFSMLGERVRVDKLIDKARALE